MSMTTETRIRINRDFGSIQLTGDHMANVIRVRQTLRDAALLIAEVVPHGREQASALTKLEEAMFHANAGIARSTWAELGSASETVPPPPTEVTCEG